MMSDSKKDAGSEVPENAFAADFQAFLGEEEERAAKEVEDWLVPWSVEPTSDDEWAVFRPGESSAAGDEPFAFFPKKRTAELYANVLFPVTQREPQYSLGLEAGEYGFPIYEKGKAEPIGHIQEPDEGWLMRFNIMTALATSPRAMRWVLADGGANLVEQVGEISFARARWLEKTRKE